MNDSDLELHLRGLRPLAPSPGLGARIGEELATSPAPVLTAGVIARPSRFGLALRLLRNLGWASAGACAALAVMALLSTPQKKAALPVASAPVMAQVEAFEPEESSRELLGVEDSENWIETEDGPVREVRYTYLERLAWAQPGTGARVEIELPREDVWLVPVSLQ